MSAAHDHDDHDDSAGPKVLATHTSAAEVARPGDGFASESELKELFFGNINRVYGTGSDPANHRYRGDYGYIIDNGRIRYRGPVSELVDNPEVRKLCGL